MTRKRTGKPRHTVKPLSIAAFEGPEYGLYYLASKSYTGYWPCQLLANEEKDGKLTGRLVVKCKSEDITW